MPQAHAQFVTRDFHALNFGLRSDLVSHLTAVSFV
jgi:hypothetical protein